MLTFTRKEREIIRRFKSVYRNIWSEMNFVEYFGGERLVPVSIGYMLHTHDGEELHFGNLHRALHRLCTGE